MKATKLPARGMDLDSLKRHRFPDDERLMKLLSEEPAVRASLENAPAVRARSDGRSEWLADAVRVDEQIVPSLGPAVAALAALARETGHVECFVNDDLAIPGINAWGINAFVEADDRGVMIVLTSAALNRLDDEELLFFVGHELGHFALGHLDLNVDALSRRPEIAPRVLMRLRAWERAAEISADRVGRVFCGSSAASIRALFKLHSGLARLDGDEGLSRTLAGQWDRSVEEVATSGGHSDWSRRDASHPSGPLRWRAMDLFSRALSSTDPVSEIAACDSEVSRMLALLDPDDPADRLLSGFLVWGGLYVALADGTITATEAERIESFAPPDLDVRSYTRAGPSAEARDKCLENFREALARRKVKLTAAELHRIVFGLIDVAAADGRLDEHELRRLRQLGGNLGVPPAGCDLLVARYLKERESGLD